jgi:hypothetical protein
MIMALDVPSLSKEEIDGFRAKFADQLRLLMTTFSASVTTHTCDGSVPGGGYKLGLNFSTEAGARFFDNTLNFATASSPQGFSPEFVVGLRGIPKAVTTEGFVYQQKIPPQARM